MAVCPLPQSTEVAVVTQNARVVFPEKYLLRERFPKI